MDKKLEIINTKFDGLFIIKPNIFTDDRGSFSRVFCIEELSTISNVSINQINHSITKEKGTVRGLHFQYEPDAEIKIVKCIKGSVLDVVVDIRKNSTTFLQSFAIELTEENKQMIYIPKGFAHGFQTLKDDTELLYLASSAYNTTNEGALNVKDPALNIKWPLKPINLSLRDKENKFLDSDYQGIKIK